MPVLPLFSLTNISWGQRFNEEFWKILIQYVSLTGMAGPFKLAAAIQ